MSYFQSKKVVSLSLLLASSLLGLSLSTQAQDQTDQDQNTALQVVAKMTEGQRTYYQKNGQFRAQVTNIQKDFGITLPPTFDYAVRTTSEAAYSYVIPSQSRVLNLSQIIEKKSTHNLRSRSLSDDLLWGQLYKSFLLHKN